MRDLSMHIMDIYQNSTRADATDIKLSIEESLTDNLLSIIIEDNGKGMSKEVVESIRNPFKTSRTTREVGLGIPLLEQTCINSNGSLTITSEEGTGTTIIATMDYDSIDRPPLGDIINTVYLLILMNEGINFTYTHKKNDKEYQLETLELKEILDGVSFQEPDISNWLRENIKEGIENLDN